MCEGGLRFTALHTSAHYCYLLKVAVAELELSTDLLQSRLLVSSHPRHD